MTSITLRSRRGTAGLEPPAVDWRCRSTRLVDRGVIVAPFVGPLLVEVNLACKARPFVNERGARGDLAVNGWRDFGRQAKPAHADTVAATDTVVLSRGAAAPIAVIVTARSKRWPARSMGSGA